MKSADRALAVAARFGSRSALPAGLPMEWNGLAENAGAPGLAFETWDLWSLHDPSENLFLSNDAHAAPRVNLS
jgi:hypothetical protein